MDISNLGIRVDSSEAADAAQNLGALTDSAKETERATESLTKKTNELSKAQEALNKKVTVRMKGGGGIKADDWMPRPDHLLKSGEALDSATASVLRLAGAQKQVAEKTVNAGNELVRMRRDAAQAAASVSTVTEAIKEESIWQETITRLRKSAGLALIGLAAGAAALFGKGIINSVQRIEAERLSLEEYERVVVKLGRSGALTREELKAFAVELQNTTGRAASETLDISAKAASFGFVGDVFENVIKRADDLAATIGGSLASNFQVLARALVEPGEGLTQLTRRGIEFTEKQVDMIRRLVDTNDKLGAQREILKVLEQQVGGVAAAGFDGLTAAWGRTIVAAQSFFDALVVGTGLMYGVEVALNVIVATLNALAGAVGPVIEALLPLTPLFLAVFGPTVLGMVLTLATAIGTTLVGSVVALFTLLAANPLTAFAAAIVTIISYTIDWQKSISGLIKIWGAFLYAWESFWGNEAGARRAIEIVLNADQATADLLATAEKMKTDIMGGFQVGNNDAYEKIWRAHADGGAQAANQIRKGHAEGAKSADERAQAIWESLNGKVVKPVGDALMAGGKFIKNEVTGAIEKASAGGANEMNKGINSGGVAAGASIASQMQTAGSSVGGNLFDTLVRAGDVWISSIQKFVGELIKRQLDAQVRLMKAQAEQLKAQAALTRQQAMDLLSGKNNRGGGGGGGGGGSGGSGSSSVNNITWQRAAMERGASASVQEPDIIKSQTYENMTMKEVDAARAKGRSTFLPVSTVARFARGGSFIVPGSGGTDSQDVRFKATPGERVDVSTPTQQAAAGQGQPKVDLHVTNVWDPQNVVTAMRTQAGRQELLNFAKANREELAAILGYSG